MQRRSFVGAALAGAAFGPAALISPAARAAGLKPLGQAHAFDYAWLKGRARNLAAAPYQQPPAKLPPDVAALDYDQYQSIAFKPDHALWADAGLRFQVKLFHLGMYLQAPGADVRGATTAGRRSWPTTRRCSTTARAASSARCSRPISASPAFASTSTWHRSTTSRRFSAPAISARPAARASTGCRHAAWRSTPALPRPEEFPDFIEFYFERPRPRSDTLVVYALLDSPSIAGAYRFAITPGDTTAMDVDAALYPRKEIERLGIAPLHQHVPDRRERPPRRQRLAARDPRLRRPVDVQRQRRMDLAPAEQPGASALQRLCRRRPARLRAAAARPRLRPTTRTTACSTTAGRACGSSRRPAGAPVRSSWSRSRRSTRPSTTSSRSGIRPTSRGRARRCCSATGSTGARDAGAAAAGALRRDAHRHRRRSSARSAVTTRGASRSTSPAATCALLDPDTPVEPVITRLARPGRDHLGAAAGVGRRLPRDVRPGPRCRHRADLAAPVPAAPTASRSARPGSTNGRRRPWPSATSAEPNERRTGQPCRSAASRRGWPIKSALRATRSPLPTSP